MKVLIINTLESRGGAAKTAWALKEGLRQMGHQTSMFVKDKFSQDPEVFELPRNTKYELRLAHYGATDINFYKSDAVLKTKQFQEADVVHCHNLHGYYFNLSTLKKIADKKPLIWTLQDMWAITPHCAHTSLESKNGFYGCENIDSYPGILWDNSRYLCHRKKNIYAKTPVSIIAPSMWLKTKLENSILKDKPITIIHNGIDTKAYRKSDKAQSRKDLDLSQDKKIILFIADYGKNNQYKGWQYSEQIIERYGNRNDMIFLCIGGSETGKKGNLIYIPYIEDTSILAKYYSCADLFLYPSLADTCPLVVAEAMSCGLPVLTFNTGGIPEIVEHKKSGYIADYKSIDDLNRGFLWWLSSTNKQIIDLADTAIRQIKNKFSQDQMIHKYLEIYNASLFNFEKIIPSSHEI